MDIEHIRKNNLILLECISGSKAYNLDLPSSDTDIKGVFYLPKELFYSSEYIPQISDENNDVVFYEIGRYIELLAKNNPNILELLATPKDKILYKHAVMNAITSEMFLSKKCKDTFAGYAMTQIRQARGLNKKIVNPIPKERKSILDFCQVLYKQGSISLNKWLKIENKQQENIGLVAIPHFKTTYGLYYSENIDVVYKGVMNKESSNNVSTSSVPKDISPLTHLYFNHDGYSKYCKDYKDYWDWVEKRNESRYENNLKHEKNYDSKNLMHTFRLLDMAEEILIEGKVNVRRENRDELLEIRSGKWTYEELVERANKKIESIAEAYEISSLPLNPNIKDIENMLVNLRMELYH